MDHDFDSYGKEIRGYSDEDKAKSIEKRRVFDGGDSNLVLLLIQM